MTRAQELRAEVSEIAHESFDGAMVVKTLGREAEETERFAAKAQRAARRQHPRRPDPGGVRPDPGGAAQPRRAGRARRRRRAGSLSGADRRRRRGHRRLPAHHRVLPDPLDRLAARRVPAQRRRLPPGAARCSTRPARCRTATARLPDADGRGARLEVDAPRLLLRRPTSGCSTTSTFTRRARPHRRGRRCDRRPARARSPRC